MTFKRVFEGCYHGFAKGNPNPVAVLERHDFGRRLWAVDVAGYGRVITGMFDCFTLDLAMKLARKAYRGELPK